MKEQRGEFLGMLLGTLGANLLGNLLIGKRREQVKPQLESVRNNWSWSGFLVPLHPLTNFEIQKYC